MQLTQKCVKRSTATPTAQPTILPTTTPTLQPSASPTATPTVSPTYAPTTPTPTACTGRADVVGMQAHTDRHAGEDALKLCAGDADRQLEIHPRRLVENIHDVDAGVQILHKYGHGHKFKLLWLLGITCLRTSLYTCLYTCVHTHRRSLMSSPSARSKCASVELCLQLGPSSSTVAILAARSSMPRPCSRTCHTTPLVPTLGWSTNPLRGIACNPANGERRGFVLYR